MAEEYREIRITYPDHQVCDIVTWARARKKYDLLAFLTTDQITHKVNPPKLLESFAPSARFKKQPLEEQLYSLLLGKNLSKAKELYEQQKKLINVHYRNEIYLFVTIKNNDIDSFEWVRTDLNLNIRSNNDAPLKAALITDQIEIIDHFFKFFDSTKIDLSDISQTLLEIAARNNRTTAFMYLYKKFSRNVSKCKMFNLTNNFNIRVFIWHEMPEEEKHLIYNMSFLTECLDHGLLKMAKDFINHVLYSRNSHEKELHNKLRTWLINNTHDANAFLNVWNFFREPKLDNIVRIKNTTILLKETNHIFFRNAYYAKNLLLCSELLKYYTPEMMTTLPTWEYNNFLKEV